MKAQVGRRKLLALVAVGVVVSVAIVAGRLWGTNGLIAVLLAVSLGGSLASGWFMAQSERRTRRLMTAVERAVKSGRRAQENRQESLNAGFTHLEERLGHLSQRVTRPSEHAEQLLKAVNSATIRMELMLERIGRSTGKEIGRNTERVLEAVGSDVDRILEAVRSDVDRILKEVKSTGNRTVRKVEHSSSGSSKQVTAVSKQLYRQLEALVALYVDTQPKIAFPPMRTWAASPDLLVYLYEIVRKLRPRLILECGSGVSTLVMAHALKKNDFGCLVSLEHLDSYRDLTLEWAADHELVDWVDVRLAPLMEVELEGEMWPWYSIEAVPDDEIDILFVDGPPGFTRSNARFPALPLLANRVTPNGLVVLDDYAREEESSVANDWARLYPDWEAMTLQHEKGTAIFEKPVSGGGAAAAPYQDEHQ